MAFDRSKLTELGVPEEAVDAVLKAHSQSVSADKGTITRLTSDLDALRAKEAEWEAARQAGMSEQERLQAALEAAAAAQEDFERKSARLDAEQVFVAAGMDPASYAPVLDSIVTRDAAATVANAQAIAALVAAQSKAATEAATKQLLGGTPQPQNGDDGPKPVSKAEFDSMTYSEKVAFKADNPDAFAAFTK